MISEEEDPDSESSFNTHQPFRKSAYGKYMPQNKKRTEIEIAVRLEIILSDSLSRYSI